MHGLKGLAAAGLLGLTGCAHGSADEASWGESDLPDEARLVYGVPETDNVSGGFSCRRGSGFVSIWTYASRARRAVFENGRWVDEAGRPEPWPDRVRFGAGGIVRDYAGEARVNEMGDLGDVAVTAVTAATDPLLAAFAASGALQTFEPGAVLAAETPIERAEIRRFFEVCAAPAAAG